MKNAADLVVQFTSLRAQLIQEKARLEARLAAIVKGLAVSDAVVIPASAPAPAAPATDAPKQKRVFSAATKAKMAKAQQARWAAKKGKVAVKAVVEAAPKQAEPKQKAKRKYSKEAKARMAAGAKARWAKVKAEKKSKVDKPF